jgi:hypothetical protein
MQLWFGSRGARGATTGATAVPRSERRGEVGVGGSLQRSGSVAGGRVEGAHDHIANEREDVEQKFALTQTHNGQGATAQKQQVRDPAAI